MIHRLAAALLALCLASPALAQTGAPSQCGPASVGTAAAAIVFPASGAHGKLAPTKYLFISNPNASGTLWVNAQPGGTAAANTAGSIPLAALGGWVEWSQPQEAPPVTVSIIGSASSMAVTCNYQ